MCPIYSAPLDYSRIGTRPRSAGALSTGEQLHRLQWHCLQSSSPAGRGAAATVRSRCINKRELPNESSLLVFHRREFPQVTRVCAVLLSSS